MGRDTFTSPCVYLNYLTVMQLAGANGKQETRPFKRCQRELFQMCSIPVLAKPEKEQEYNKSAFKPTPRCAEVVG